VTNTLNEALAQGSVRYRNGQLVREPLGSGATVVSFGGARRRVIPAPVGDLEAARVASGAPDVVAYIATERPAGQASHSWAEVTWPDDRVYEAELRLGDGNVATAAIAAETVSRMLVGAPAGAWTPCRLFGVDLVMHAIEPAELQLGA